MTVNKGSPGIRLAVRVTPNAGHNDVIGVKDGVLQVKIAAAPEKGKANKELIDFLAEKLKIKKSSILIIKGQASRHKVLFIQDVGKDILSELIKIL